jgi:PilZ domain
MKTEDVGARGKERRRAPRYRYQASLEIEWGSARLKGRTRDISEGGMFIESEDVLWVGAGFRACLVADRAVWLNCSVKRVEPGYGMGVAIAHPENQSQQQFEDLLAKLSSPA